MKVCTMLRRLNDKSSSSVINYDECYTINYQNIFYLVTKWSSYLHVDYFPFEY
jgi:hypothetical protein